MYPLMGLPCKEIAYNAHLDNYKLKNGPPLNHRDPSVMPIISNFLNLRL